MRKTKSKPTRYICLAMLFVLTVSASVEQVHSLPTGANAENSWPNFDKRNVAALARDGYLKSQSNGYKRSISTLAKNGQLPTFRSPYDDTDTHEEEDDGHEKRNMASIARMRTYSVMKRNIQALARDGYRVGRQSSQQNNKRNIASLARSGFIHKRGDSDIEEYYYPFYQNSVPPLTEIDGPLDDNEVYDFQQSINPDFFPPLAQVYKRSPLMYYDQNEENERANENQDYLNSVSFKRRAVGMPVQGLFRPTYVDSNYRTKRYILSLPEPIDQNNLPLPDIEDTNVEDKRSVDEGFDMRESFEKRHIGSLARLGLLPSFRYSGSRYSRSGRARLLLPSQDFYRKHSFDENFGVREYIPSTEAEPAADTDDTNVPPPAVSPHSHPTGRILNRPLNNELPPQTYFKDKPHDPFTGYIEALTKNSWRSNTKEIPRFYHFRSVKVPYHTSGKRYLLFPAVDNIMLRKTYPNGSLPSRRKNQ